MAAVKGQPTIALKAVKKMKQAYCCCSQKPTIKQVMYSPKELGRNDVVELKNPGENSDTSK